MRCSAIAGFGISVVRFRCSPCSSMSLYGCTFSRFSFTQTHRTGLPGNSPVARSILQRLPIQLSSMGSVLCRLPKNCARQELRRTSNSLFGWRSWIVAGLLNEGSGTTCKATQIVTFVDKQLNLYITCFLVAFTPGRFGSGFFVPSVCSTSVQRRTLLWRHGG
jgi:hypothetical protein